MKAAASSSPYDSWSGGSLSVAITVNKDAANDLLGIVSAGSIWVSGTDVRYGASYAAGTSFGTLHPLHLGRRIVGCIQRQCDRHHGPGSGRRHWLQRPERLQLGSTYRAIHVLHNK